MKTANTEKVVYLSVTLFLTFIFPCCNSRRPQTIKKKLTITYKPLLETQLAIEQVDTQPPITVWIHGTRFITTNLFKRNFNSKAGIKLATDIDTRYHLRIIANALSTSAPETFPLDTFYVFCWSGKLNATMRKHVAHDLYAALLNVIEEYKQTYDSDPRIQVITHSHGGNVVLNLAKIKNLKEQQFIIDSLILLACPV